MTRVPILFVFLLLGTCVRAQTQMQEAESLALHAYLTADLEGWQRAIEAATQLADERQRLLTVTEYQFGLATASMAGEERDATLVDALDAMDDTIDDYWELDKENARMHGLYSALLGFRIARKPIMGMAYGSKAGKYAERAVTLGPDDPVALYHAAGNLFYTPEQWGGNPQLALEYLDKASRLFGTDRDTDWRYLATLALRGQVEAQLGHTDRARATYAEALAAQPDFAYVSKVLLPSLK